MNIRRTVPWLCVGLVALLAVSCDGCERAEDETGPDDLAAVEDPNLRECPHTWEFAAEADRAELQRVTGGGYNVPEANDCQRFIVRGTNGFRYIGRFAIFAADLDRLPAKMAEYPRSAVAAAVIYSPDDVAYDSLGIQGRWSCLAIQGNIENPTSALRAAMIPISVVKECDGPLNLSDGRPLQVTRDTKIGTDLGQNAHYPPLARWGFDQSGPLQYAIIKCGIATCYIGPETARPRAMPDSLASPGAPAEERRVFSIAGWHDAQPLAVLDEATGELRPSDTWGIAIPDPRLGALNAAAQFENKWVRVASIAITTDLYRSKFGLDPTTRDRLNEIWACQGGACPGVPDTLDCGSVDPYSQGPGKEWRTMVISAVRRDSTYHCTRRYETDSTFKVPAAARLRWRPDDEKLWYRCLNGCCDAE